MKILFILLLMIVCIYSIPVTTCQIINTPGDYQLSNDLIGADNSLAPLIFVNKACIFIVTSNVSLDGNGFSITNNGTIDSVGIFTNVSTTNVSIFNFFNITQYKYGIYNYVSNGINITNNTIQNNSLDNIHLDNTENSSIISNRFSLGGSDAIVLEKGINNSIINNQIHGMSQFGVHADTASISNLISNNIINTSGFGILTQGINITIIDNRIRNTTNGIVSGSTTNRNNLINRNILTSIDQYAIWVNEAENTTISNNNISNSFVGYYITLSVTGTTIYGNIVNGNQYGATVSITNLTNITNEHYYNNNNDFYVNNLPSDVGVTMNASGLVFDNPNGNFANYTNLSINDFIDAKAVYIINWSAQPAPLPSGEISFNKKFLNISNQNISLGIDQLIWRWTAAEEVGYTPALLKLRRYNGSWVNTSYVLNTVARTLTQNNLTETSVFGIVQDNSNLSIILVAPPNNQFIPNNITNLTFFIIDPFFPTANCSVFLNNTVLVANQTVMNNTNVSINTTQLRAGTYTWFVICIDPNTNATSETWTFFVRGPGGVGHPGSNIMLITYSLILYGLWYITDKKLGKRFNPMLKYSTLVIIVFFTLFNINMMIEFNRYISVQQYSPTGFTYNDPNTGVSTTMYGASTIDSGTVLAYHYSEYIIWVLLSTLLPYMFILIMFLLIVQFGSFFYDIYLGKTKDDGYGKK